MEVEVEEAIGQEEVAGAIAEDIRTEGINEVLCGC